MGKPRMCKDSGVPCDRVSASNGNPCLICSKGGRVLYACVRIRFRGKNSVKEQGFGMTILEKLERQGLIK